MLVSIIVSIVSFFLLCLAMHFFLRNTNKAPETIPAAREYAAVRGSYHILLILILWVTLLLFSPLLLSYKKHLEGLSTQNQRLWLLPKAFFIPVVYLLILRFAKRRGALAWIKDRYWPGGKDV